MRGPVIRLTLLSTAIAVVGLIGAACGGGGGSGGPPSSGCDSQWRANDPTYATQMVATIAPGGAATESNGTLTLSFSGTLPGSAASGLAFQTGVVYAKGHLQGDFQSAVHLLSYSATGGTNLAVFVAVQGSPTGSAYGQRFWVEQERGGPVFLESDWYANSYYPTAPTSTIGVPTGAFDFHRVGSTTLLFATAGNDTYNGSNGGPGNELADVVGIGIANPEQVPASGSMTVRFGALAVTDTSGNCFTSGLD